LISIIIFGYFNVTRFFMFLIFIISKLILKFKLNLLLLIVFYNLSWNQILPRSYQSPLPSRKNLKKTSFRIFQRRSINKWSKKWKSRRSKTRLIKLREERSSTTLSPANAKRPPILRQTFNLQRPFKITALLIRKWWNGLKTT